MIRQRTEKPVLNVWEQMSDTMVYNKSYPSITLGMNAYHSIACTVRPNGEIQLTTEDRGGHGEGSWKDAGRSATEWIMLIAEAQAVAEYYWGEVNGLS